MFDQPPKKSTGITLAKLVVILAVTAGVSFGLCTASAMMGASGERVGVVTGPIAVFFGGLCVISLTGLVIFGVIAVVVAIVNSIRGTGNN